MPLEEYHKKRQFNKTPEPKGKESKTKGPLIFVVQKHHASQLHFDFRLELDGVLKSWAVPKGPSMNPHDKRLAMMVEDHPLDYANFEGIIPKGSYGAGTVMVWDNGVYSPLDSVERSEAEKILSEQLKKGHLTFVLLGKKLKGEFALIKLKKSDGNAWLLIKKGDEYASSKDILKEDKSVLTNRSMEEISNQAGKKKEVWIGTPKNLDLFNAPKSKMPHSISPMLAKSVDKAFNNKDWIFELKWDGYRALAEVELGRVRLYSRNNLSYNEKFIPIIESLKKFPGNVLLDGEVVVLDKKGHPNFQLLQDYPKSSGELIYYLFDILHFNGHDLANLPLIKRKEILKQLLPPLPHLAYSDHIEEEGVEFFKQAEKLNLEGIMAKNSQSTYRAGVRSEDWLKIKTHLTQEAIIAGFTAPNGGRKHFGALVLGMYEGGELKYIGHTGGGFNDKKLEEIIDELKDLKQDRCPFKVAPKTNAPVTWVKPKLICEVKFASWTNDHLMRAPIFVRLHPLSFPRTRESMDPYVRHENDKKSIVASEKRIFSKVHPDKEETTQVQIGKRILKLTHLSKVFWPASRGEPHEKITKGDLINYYREVAPVILPHLKDRPQSLLRYPNGIEGEGFFQKDASLLKMDWVMRARVHSKHEKKYIEYLLCQDEATLVYMINLGCIDLNPWSSTIHHLDKPDYLVIDLDPEEDTFEDVVKVALEIRERLEKLEIESFPKTSGGRGMHIYIPMGAKYSYDQVRTFAQLLCSQIQNKIPSLTSMIRNPKQRKGKVYLDYLQNSKGQTLASVYSVRPKPGTPVSTPLTWQEVNLKLYPSQFTIQNIPQRLQKEGDLFMGVLGKGVNIEKVIKKMSL